MSCKKYQLWLEEAALGDLPAKKQQELDAHVSTCMSCQLEMERESNLLAAIDAGLAESVKAEPSLEFASRTRRRIVREQLTPAWPLRWYGLAAAGALALAAIVIYVQRPAPVNDAPVVASNPRTISAPAPKGEKISSKAMGKTHLNLAQTQEATPVTTEVAVVETKTEFEIVIDPRQIEGVRAFVRVMNAGAMDAAAAITPQKYEILAWNWKPVLTPDVYVPIVQIPALEQERKEGRPTGSR